MGFSWEFHGIFCFVRHMMVHFWSSNMAHDPCRCHQVSCCGHRPGALLHLDPDQCEVPRGIAMAALEGVDFQGVPSGKHTKNYGKSPFLMGKSTIMAIFNSKLLVYQRVYLQQKKKGILQRRFLMEHISMQKSLGYGRQTWRWKSTMFIS